MSHKIITDVPFTGGTLSLSTFALNSLQTSGITKTSTPVHSLPFLDSNPSALYDQLVASKSSGSS